MHTSAGKRALSQPLGVLGSFLWRAAMHCPVCWALHQCAWLKGQKVLEPSQGASL